MRILLDHGYLDIFTNEYVVTKDTIAPPERYVSIIRGTDGVCIEEWNVILNDSSLRTPGRLSIAYDAKEYRNGVLHHTKMEHMKKQHNCKLISLFSYTCPSEEFDELFKSYI